MVQDLEAGRMATLLYMVIEPDLGSVRFASAGHLPPLVHRPGRRRALPRGRPHAAARRDAEHRVPGGARSSSRPGATLVLYTDGLVEERGESIDAGLDALKEAVSAAARRARARCATTSSTQLLAHRPATDDIAVLAVHTVADVGERLHLDLPDQPEVARHAAAHRRRAGSSRSAPRGEESRTTSRCRATRRASNAMEHAYRFREATIEVDGEFDGAEVRLTVADQGGWREKRDNDRGRGLDLIRALMDSIEVDPGVDGTTVRMSRRLADATPSPDDAAAAAAVDAS